MPARFTIPNVSGEVIMDVAKVVSAAPNPIGREDIGRSFENRYSIPYINQAITACEQLSLMERVGTEYVGSRKHRDMIGRSNRDELALSLRTALQEYPPFLLFVEFVTRGYSETNAASMTRGILKIESGIDKVEKAMRNWGEYAGIVDKQTGKLVRPVETDQKRLTAEFVKGLLEALDDELKANIFLVRSLSPQGYADLVEKDIGINELSAALRSYQDDPRASAQKSTHVFERFLFRLGEEVGSKPQEASGPIELVDAIRGTKLSSGNKAILVNQTLISHGIGAIRNMSAHAIDKETGEAWIFTPQGALISTLLVSASIRSINLYVREKKQEF